MSQLHGVILLPLLLLLMMRHLVNPMLPAPATAAAWPGWSLLLLLKHLKGFWEQIAHQMVT
jgi:hypothetical protein